MNWTVHKFGGSSLADARGFERAAGIVLADDAPRVAVVVSAMQGVTNALFALIEHAVAGDERWQGDLKALQEAYAATAGELIADADRRAELLEAQRLECRDVSDILHSAALIRSAGPRVEALVSGCGELWSARLLAALIEERGAAKRPGGRVAGRARGPARGAGGTGRGCGLGGLGQAPGAPA